MSNAKEVINSELSKAEINKSSSKACCAKNNFLSGYTCAQAVIAAFSNEKWFINSGLSLETAMRLSSSFGGGMGRLREVCGTVSAMFMLAGLAFGFDKPMPKTECSITGNTASKPTEGTTNAANPRVSDTPITNAAHLKTDHYKRIQELAAMFRAENGSIICRELLGLTKAPQSNEQPQNKTQSQNINNVVEGNAYSPIPENRTDAYYKKRPCPELCACAAAIFENYLNNHISG